MSRGKEREEVRRGGEGTGRGRGACRIRFDLPNVMFVWWFSSVFLLFGFLFFGTGGESFLSL